MYMRLMQLMVVAILVVFTQPAAFAKGKKSKCRFNEFTKELLKKKGTIIHDYMHWFARDGADCANADIQKYLDWNSEVEEILHYFSCTWDNIPGLYKVEKREDLCKSAVFVPTLSEKPVADNQADDGPEKLKVVLLPEPKEDDLALPESVPLVDPNPKATDKKPPVVVKPPAKKPESKPVVAITQPTKKPVKKLPPAVTITKSPPPAKKSYWLTGTGVGVGVAGLALLGGGTYFALQARSAEDSAWDATTQSDVIRFNKEASDHATNANIMFGVGGATVAVGIVLVILDLTVWGSPNDTSDNKSSTASIKVGPGSVNLIMRF